MPPLATEIHACRACGSAQLAEVLDLGLFSLSDFLDSPDAHTDRAPLTLVRCEDCTLVQLRHTVDRDRLYRSYWYRSSTQPAMVKALQDVVRDATSRVSLQFGDVVVDVGSNDGTLLKQYPDGVDCWGVEPSRSFGIPPWVSGWQTAYWPLKLHIYKPAKIITSVACFYDVDDPGAFVAGIAANLADDGIWVNQMAYLPDTLAANNFGDICHEHLTYWTVQSFSSLLGAHGLYLNDYSFNDVNGGSIRTIVSRTPVGKHRADAPSLADFGAFETGMMRQRVRIHRLLNELAAANSLTVGYGASTKGNTYLQYWGVSRHAVRYIADRNPDKWGKYTPTGQKVISEAEARAMQPDFFFILPFHFLPAFIEREQAFFERGGRFLVPFPELRVIGGTDADLQPSRVASGVLAET